MEREEQIRKDGSHPEQTDRFDVDQFLSASAEAELQRIHEQVAAKDQQIQRRIALYEETVATLETELRKIDRELDRLLRTSEARPRLESRRDTLQRDLVETRRRFQADLRELEDAKLALEEELEELVEARVLVDGMNRSEDNYGL